MDSDKARAKLEEVKNAANTALNAMAPYVRAVQAGLVTSSSVKLREIAKIKALALKAGVDIEEWTGQSASE